MPMNRFVNREYFNPETSVGLLLWQRIVNANEPRRKYTILNGANVVAETFPNLQNHIWSIAQYPELQSHGNWLTVTLYAISAGGISGFNIKYGGGVYTGGSGACYLGQNLLLRVFDDLGVPIEYQLDGWGNPHAGSRVITGSKWAPEWNPQSGTLNDQTGFRLYPTRNVTVDGQTVLAGTNILALSRGRSEQDGGPNDGEAGGRILVAPSSSSLLLKYGPNTSISASDGNRGIDYGQPSGTRRSPPWKFTQAQISSLNQLWLKPTFSHGLTTANTLKRTSSFTGQFTLQRATFASLTMILGE